MWFWIVLVVLLAVILLYLAAVQFMAKKEVMQAPREDMTECHSGKHGAYPKKFSIVSNDYGTEEPVLICPWCYEEACKMAMQSNGLKKNAEHEI
jgi:hypothetical protein